MKSPLHLQSEINFISALYLSLTVAFGPNIPSCSPIFLSVAYASKMVLGCLVAKEVDMPGFFFVIALTMIY